MVINTIPQVTRGSLDCYSLVDGFLCGFSNNIFGVFGAARCKRASREPPAVQHSPHLPVQGAILTPSSAAAV